MSEIILFLNAFFIEKKRLSKYHYNLKQLLTSIYFYFFAAAIIGQTSQLKGIVLNEQKQPVELAEVTYGTKGTQTDKDGFYLLEIPSNTETTVQFQHLGLKSVTIKVNLKPNQQLEFNPILKADIEQIQEVVITAANKNDIEGIVNLDPKTIRNTPSANAGVESLLKTLPGVSSNNELSTQYNVRGGNFDENLVYVNEIEVYRPFLVRSGQQEGLSFVNTQLVDNVAFSAGGFQAKYGDKLSSVLDITYRRPKKIGATLEASLLGGALSLEGISKDANTSGILGMRYRDNKLLVDARDTESNFRPIFADIQGYFAHNFSSKFELSFLGNVAINDYRFEPLTRRTNFGTFDSPRELSVVFNGKEETNYQTLFGALKGTYKPNKDLSLRFIGSLFHTQEEEFFDILGQYLVGQTNNAIGSDDFGEIQTIEGVGGQLLSGRNTLDALIFNLQHKGTWKQNNNQFDWGIKYTLEDFRDRVREFEFADNAGRFVNPIGFDDFIDPSPNNPTDDRTDQRIVPLYNVNAKNETQINRISGFGQWSKKTFIGDHQVWLNAGLRFHNWTVSGKNTNQNFDNVSKIVFSPRAQFAIKPNWKNKDMLFRFSTGLYYQPPFYRELRNFNNTTVSNTANFVPNGQVVPTVDAQRSFHISLGNEYSLKIWDRPFKMTSEIYYKKLNDVNTYSLENVRIRYRANNNAEAFAYGLDFRLNGEFVPGIESWLSVGYLNTQENQDNRGYISRPTDQRFKFAMLFQDYVKKIPNLRAYLNLVYQTGLPGGSPSFSDPYDFQTRLPDFKRVDLGTFYTIVDRNKNKKAKTLKFLNSFESFDIGFEIYNIFNFRNAISNTFIRDANSLGQFAIPNFLTQRVLNVKLRMSL